METSNFIKIAIGATILLLFVATVITPLLGGVTYTKTAENEPTGYATSNLITETYTISTNGVTTGGGEAIPMNLEDWILVSNNVLVTWYTNSLILTDFQNGATHYGSSISIDADSQTWAMGQYSGDLGDNALIRSTAGELGTYYNKEFHIDRNAQSKVVFVQSTTITGTTQTARAVISGDVENLTVQAIAITGYPSNFVAVDPDDATVQISDSITGEDFKNYTIAANPAVTLTFEYDGSDVTLTSRATSIAAPIEYLTTVDNGEITTMIGIVPLLMIVGVITMIIGAFIIRRS